MPRRKKAHLRLAVDTPPVNLTGGQDVIARQVQRALYRPWLSVSGGGLLTEWWSREGIWLTPKVDRAPTADLLAAFRVAFSDYSPIARVLGIEGCELRGNALLVSFGHCVEWTLAFLRQLPSDGIESPTGPFRATSDPSVYESHEHLVSFTTCVGETAVEAFAAGRIDATCPTDFDCGRVLATLGGPTEHASHDGIFVEVVTAEQNTQPRLPPADECLPLPGVTWAGSVNEGTTLSNGARGELLYAAYWPNEAIARAVASYSSNDLEPVPVSLPHLVSTVASGEFQHALCLGEGLGVGPTAYALRVAAELAMQGDEAGATALINGARQKRGKRPLRACAAGRRVVAGIRGRWATRGAMRSVPVDRGLMYCLEGLA